MRPSGPATTERRPRAGGRRGLLYWALAVLVMLVAAAYQRRTGPTYPVTGTLSVDGQMRPYALLTSHDTGADAPVVLPGPGVSPAGAVYFRRYPTGDDYVAAPLHVADGRATAALPAQPPAGKLQYYIRLQTRDGPVRIPEDPDKTVIIRFKGHVPIGVLLPHVLLMFLSMLVGVRAAIAALVREEGTRAFAWTAFAGMTLGGMILGPIVQYYAFGAAWTGVPFGWDLTDNKTLLMWLVWFVACLAPGLKGAARSRRPLVLAASIIMLAVYLVPHSAAGSELDWSQQGAPAGPAGPP